MSWPYLAYCSKLSLIFLDEIKISDYFQIIIFNSPIIFLNAFKEKQ